MPTRWMILFLRWGARAVSLFFASVFIELLFQLLTHSLILIELMKSLEAGQRIMFLSLSTVLLHVSVGRPRLLLPPPSDAHVSLVLEILSKRFLNTCYIYRHLLTRMRADTGVLSVASYSSLWLRCLDSALSSDMCGETHPVC